MFVASQSKEAWFFMPAPKAVSQSDETIEGTTLNASANVDSALLAALTDPEQGAMRAGAMPSVDSLNPVANKALLQAMSGEACVQKHCAHEGIKRTLFFTLQLVQQLWYSVFFWV